MSTRGRHPGSVPRPTTPPDPSLTTRPVPSHRNFRQLSFGQGTASDPPFRTLVELDILPEADPALSREIAYQRSLDEVRKLLDVICDQELAANPDDVSCHIPTCGFWVFITEYSPFALENLSQAIENLVKVTERNLGLSLPAYRSEAARRFKLDVVQDKEALEGASDDRLREEFKSLLRGLNLMDKDDCPIVFLRSLYFKLTNGSVLDELLPLQSMCY